MPYLTQVAAGQRSSLSIYGKDYPTRDGTGVRDYIHVTDLVLGHLRALEELRRGARLAIYNLGTGKGYSVLEVFQALERVIGRSIPHQFVDRRPRDVAEACADPTRAPEQLGWTAERGIEQMCADAWRWQTLNPDGYASRT